MIYNPAVTELLFDAQSLKIPCTNGLSMLVAQAKRACELFLGVTIDDGVIDEITAKIEKSTKNIVLVGMPGCGKSTVGALLSEMTGRALVDTDEMIVEEEKRDIPTIFAADGEDYFRRAEHKAICKAGKQSSLIISTGGGAVTRDENYRSLGQNGVVFYIERDTNSLSRDGRPLSQSGNLEEMFKKREPMYKKFSNYTIKNDSTAQECAEMIIKAFKGEIDK
jgi:shikimate dehydrogenase